MNSTIDPNISQRTAWPTLCGAVLVFASATGPAVAAVPAGVSDTDTSDVQEIVVTATRVVRAGFTAPTPTTTVDAGYIADTGAANVADVLNQIPAFRPTITATTSDSRTFAPGASYADLRGFGATRTLVLVNGERVVPEVGSYSAAITNQVDLGIFPTVAIERVDVITGGASAAWGSDAVAGVVNLNLYKHYEGLLTQISGGESQRGDNRSINFGILAGTAFNDGRGHFTIAGEFDDNRGIGDIYTRPWSRTAPYVLANPACKGCYVEGYNYQFAALAPGGLITAGPLKGTAFGPGGQPYAFPYGSFISGSGMFGGGTPGNTPQAGIYMEPPVKKWNLYHYTDYELTNSLTAHVQFDRSEVTANTVGNQYNPTFNINSGNPYIPATVQAVMTANNLPSISVGDYATDIGRVRESVDDVTTRVSAGLSWDIGHTWKADGYYTFGENYDDQTYSNVINTANAAQAVNAVNVNGQTVCANTANNCVPLNLFGLGSPAPAALAYITGDAFEHIRYVQQVAAANVRGEPVNTWAGPVSIAAGAEYRQESQTNTVDAAQFAGAYKSALQNALNNPEFRAKLHVSEAYAETVIPVLKDLPFVKELDVNAADRETHYSTIGGANTWKFGATWNVTDELLLRATKSRDIRAPNLTELFYPSVQTASQAIPGQSLPVPVINGGNVNLKPEVAKSLTAGIIYSPHFIAGLHVSLDYFDINLKDAISVANGLQIYNLCSQGFQSWCALETKSGAQITQFNATFANLSNVFTRGVDLELAYSVPLSRMVESIPGALTLRALVTYTSDLSYQLGEGLPVFNHAGQVSAGLFTASPFYAPRFKGTFSAGYAGDRFSTSLIANFISAGVEDTTITTTQFPNNDIPAYVTFNLLGSYYLDAASKIQLFATVNNLFDKSPPIDPVLTLNIPTAAGLYDIIGRTYKIGIRSKF